MNFKEILELMTEKEISYMNFANEEYLDQELFGEVIEVDSVGGYEGGGEHQEKVFYFKDHDVYGKMEGYFDSWGGATLDTFREVKPYQTTITAYTYEF